MFLRKGGRGGGRGIAKKKKNTCEFALLGDFKIFSSVLTFYAYSFKTRTRTSLYEVHLNIIISMSFTVLIHSLFIYVCFCASVSVRSESFESLFCVGIKSIYVLCINQSIH